MRRSAELLADGTRLFGPYYRKDGRQHVILIYADGKRRTVSYPKFMMEQKLGRRLDPVLETIDHKNDDHTDNRLSNLRIMSLSKHVSEDVIRVKPVEATCAWCKQLFTLSRHQREPRKNALAGPFCSNSCSGHYGVSVQKGGARLKRVRYETAYGKNKMGAWRNGIRRGL